MVTELPQCPVCLLPLSVRLTHGRKSGKPFVMLICAADGRHFRGFITHRPYVQELLDKLENLEVQQE
ncbi:MAG: hypothetical protein PHR43_03910 [Dehalococcoidales bacterium]|nr:hypothetical protein [Dehalococcoidales bacterium]